MNPATNLFHQGRMNYAFDMNVKMQASAGASMMGTGGVPGVTPIQGSMGASGHYAGTPMMDSDVKGNAPMMA
jgi:hypothetical protein